MKTAFFIPALLSLWAASAPASEKLTAPIQCEDCAGWNEAKEPVRLYGESWNVGIAGMASVLIASREGLVLIDGDLPDRKSVV